MNKKGLIALTPVFIIAVFLGIVLLPFLLSGGISGAWNLGQIIADVTKFMKTLPTFVWIILGIVIVYWLFGRK